MRYYPYIGSSGLQLKMYTSVFRYLGNIPLLFSPGQYEALFNVDLLLSTISISCIVITRIFPATICRVARCVKHSERRRDLPYL